MADIGNPGGFDIATVLAGSGVTFLIAAGITRYGAQFQYTTAELYGVAGATFLGLGIVFGVILLLAGLR
ncbi:hypothetical protein ACFO0N_21070 [Halobium salinum]|uniref:Uncharacterized protein n=1 Tax=Halobium salinum TaxID=1364940 RepID=A0ABD5PII4_9EURY|nr:hypothetical protein [Halobium salinum]